MEDAEKIKMVEDLMLKKIRELVERGYTNMSAIAGIIGGCWYPTLGEDKKYLRLGFMEVRKRAEFQYKMYQQELSIKNKKR